MPRTKRDFRQVSREMYKEFKLTHPEINISFEQYKEVVTSFNEGFRDHILDTGDIVKYPFGLGMFSIDKRKTKRTVVHDGEEKIILPVDWKKTNEARLKDPNAKRIYIFNSHSNGYRFSWFWQPNSARFILADLYVFKPYRISSRKIAEYIKKPNSPYIDLYKELRRK